MKSTQFATLLFSALLALLAGCATAEPEIESPADITVSELETKMRTAMDPDGRYAKAKPLSRGRSSPRSDFWTIRRSRSSK